MAMGDDSSGVTVLPTDTIGMVVQFDTKAKYIV
jgi:hypothetical protein